MALPVIAGIGLLALVKFIGVWLMRHIALVLLLAIGGFLLDATIFFTVAASFLPYIISSINTITGGISDLRAHLGSQWSASSQYISLANSLFPIDYAIYLLTTFIIPIFVLTLSVKVLKWLYTFLRG